MRLAIINLTSGGIGGGYSRYLLEMIPRLAASPNIEALLCCSPATLRVGSWFKPFPKLTFIDSRPFRFMHHIPDHYLKKDLEKFQPDVIFIPIERYLKFKDIPTVVMVQNMEPFIKPLKPKLFKEKLKLYALALESRIALKKSDRVIVISNFVKEFITKQLSISEEKSALVYFGVNALPEGSAIRPQTVPENWSGNFLFTAGGIELYRGLEDLIAAMEYLKQKNSQLLLAVAGDARPQMTKYRDNLKDLVGSKSLTKNVVWTGQLNENEMTWCYQNCVAFIMTSRVESFGMIGVEAMSNGCVCIAADNPCLPEIFSDAALYYPPGKGDILAEKILTTINYDENERIKISGIAKKRASQFSWDNTLNRTVEELIKARDKTK